jgi:hypothetical protein
LLLTAEAEVEAVAEDVVGMGGLGAECSGKCKSTAELVVSSGGGGRGAGV